MTATVIRFKSRELVVNVPREAGSRDKFDNGFRCVLHRSCTTLFQGARFRDRPELKRPKLNRGRRLVRFSELDVSAER